MGTAGTTGDAAPRQSICRARCLFSLWICFSFHEALRLKTWLVDWRFFVDCNSWLIACVLYRAGPGESVIFFFVLGLHFFVPKSAPAGPTHRTSRQPSVFCEERRTVE